MMHPPRKPRYGPNRGHQETLSPSAGDQTAFPSKIVPPHTMSKAQMFDEAKIELDRKPNYSTYTYDHVWGIFKPFWNCNVANKQVFISTWNIAHPSTMDERIIDALTAKAAHVRLLVGYNRNEHSLDRLNTILRDYQTLGFHVRILPGYHSKIWGVGNDAWVGSCNFVPSTIHNLMMQTTWEKVHDYASFYWQHALEYTQSTKLELAPQAPSFLKGMGSLL